jgi:hypothetical protein
MSRCEYTIERKNGNVDLVALASVRTQVQLLIQGPSAYVGQRPGSSPLSPAPHLLFSADIMISKDHSED